MKYLIDTDVIVDYLSAVPYAVNLLPTLAQDGFGISGMTIGEVYEGIYNSKAPQHNERAFERLIERVDIFYTNYAIMLRFAQVRQQFRSVDKTLLKTIGDADILIAATALHHHLILTTRNKKHFMHIPHLKAHYPPI